MMPTIIEKPKISIAEDVLHSLEKYTSREGQVIVHGLCKTTSESSYIRIWPTTFLFDQHSDHRSELVHHEKISKFPVWTMIPPYVDYVFTLIFTGLPKSCILFNLKEVIPESNGFSVPSILRNETDVYYLDFSS